MKEAILHFSAEAEDHFKITILIGRSIIIITEIKMKMAGILINHSKTKTQKKSMIVLKVNIKVGMIMMVPRNRIATTTIINKIIKVDINQIIIEVAIINKTEI